MTSPFLLTRLAISTFLIFLLRLNFLWTHRPRLFNNTGYSRVKIQTYNKTVLKSAQRAALKNWIYPPPTRSSTAGLAARRLAPARGRPPRRADRRAPIPPLSGGAPFFRAGAVCRKAAARHRMPAAECFLREGARNTSKLPNYFPRRRALLYKSRPAFLR